MFRRVAHAAADALGSSWAFALAVLVVIIWAGVGPYVGYSDSWQLFMDTGTSVVTFLVVFLIQNAQNRDARAIHLKLDELIHGVQGARNALINLQELTDEQLEQLQKEFQRIKHTGANLSQIADDEPAHYAGLPGDRCTAPGGAGDVIATIGPSVV
jgi:low affinity Fe/Cu permease